MTRLRLLPILPLLALFATGTVRAEESSGLPGWLAGSWQMQQGAAWAEELWTEPRGDMMVGVGREGFGPQVETWEIVRIQRRSDGRLVLTAQVRGGQAVDFPMTVASEEAIEFANPAHDFPQRIRYWRQGQLLMAEASRIDGSNPTRWNYRPVAGPGDERQ